MAAPPVACFFLLGAEARPGRNQGGGRRRWTEWEGDRKRIRSRRPGQVKRWFTYITNLDEFLYKNENLLTSNVRLSSVNASLISLKNAHASVHEEMLTFFFSRIFFTGTENPTAPEERGGASTAVKMGE